MKAVKLLLIIAVSLSLSKLNAQDIHFSQLGYSPLNLNPALTGIFEGDMRLTMNYRQQWNPIVNYETFSGAFDMSFYNDEYQKRFFSGGLLFNYDVAGDSRLTLANLGLTGSYTHRVGKAHYLSFGAMAAYNNRSFDISDLTFVSQYDTETQTFNGNIDPNEDAFNASVTLFDVSAGVNWHYRVPKRNKRTSFDIGLGIMHFNQPERAFLSEFDTEKLPLRWSTYAFSTIQVHDKIDILLQGSFQDQGPHRELYYGGGLQLHLNTDYDEEIALQLAFNRRAKDAWSPMFGVRYRMWKAALSYDLNTSPFRVGTNRRGGPELSVIYIFTKVKPMEAKICPIYL
ncbi:MAG: PorP/SprF family type IX secretion system membrane protein [Bacteroidota bacterium]